MQILTFQFNIIRLVRIQITIQTKFNKLSIEFLILGVGLNKCQNYLRQPSANMPSGFSRLGFESFAYVHVWGKQSRWGMWP